MLLALAMLTATGIGLWPAYVMPFLVGALIDGYGFTESQAGILGSAELSSIVICSMIGAQFISRGAGYRMLALAGVATTVIGYLGSMSFSGFTELLACRIMVGCGEGAALAAGMAVVTLFREPDRVFGVVMIARGFIGSLMLPAIGAIIVAFQHLGAFAFMIAVSLIVSPALLLLPKAPPASARTVANDQHPKRYEHLIPGLLLLLGLMLITLIESSMYTFLERRGHEIGMSTGLIANTLAIAMIIGMCGAGLPALIGTRFGRRIPIIVSAAMISVTAIITVTATDSFVYGLGLTLFSIFMAIAMPYCIGAASLLDQTGVWAATIGSMTIGGHAFGPALSGFIVQYYGFGGLALFEGVLGLIALSAFVLFFIRTERSENFP